MNAPDKTIVDRSKPHRNSEVAKAVRRTREQLSQKIGNPVFDRELIKIHARSIMSGAGVLHLLVVIVAAGGMLSGVKQQMIVWALISLAWALATQGVASVPAAAAVPTINPRLDDLIDIAIPPDCEKSSIARSF